ncbi:MAG: hypothetical protein JXQ80_05080 [Bacteroidales bacterium]|nr:hypothetical protein [Bacteroidales bacterium]
MAAYAELYEQKAEQLKETIENKYWDSSRKLFSDTNEKKYFSQHANALAILIGLVDDKDIETVSNSLLPDKSLTECTLYFSYYPNLFLEFKNRIPLEKLNGINLIRFQDIRHHRMQFCKSSIVLILSKS